MQTHDAIHMLSRMLVMSMRELKVYRVQRSFDLVKPIIPGSPVVGICDVNMRVNNYECNIRIRCTLFQKTN